MVKQKARRGMGPKDPHANAMLGLDSPHKRMKLSVFKSVLIGIFVYLPPNLIVRDKTGAFHKKS